MDAVAVWNPSLHDFPPSEIEFRQAARAAFQNSTVFIQSRATAVPDGRGFPARDEIH
jgi:hypothetical protein